MPTNTFQRMANVNGQITPLEEARISILDRGFLYGDSVYEVFRTYAGVLPRAFRSDGEFGPPHLHDGLAIA
jgi:branched-subunit amino acid aminotransferase/4-amino-4-deoxychorismate lyase